jgi:hypothetical protein
MAEPDGSAISARLWRLPGQLLLALINATAILVIVAAIVAIVAITRTNHFAEDVVATTTEAVLSKVDLPQKDVLTNIRNLTAEVGTLGRTLREIKAGEHPALQSELTQLKEALTDLKVSIDRLGSARSILTDEAIAQLSRTVTDALTKLRDCSSSARQVASPVSPPLRGIDLPQERTALVSLPQSSHKGEGEVRGPGPPSAATKP